MNSTIDTIIESLSACEDDLTDAVYEQFFRESPSSAELMGHSDHIMRGRMLEQVFELLMDDTHLEPGGYLKWEVDNHVTAYAVNTGMYVPFMHAIRDCLKQAVGDAWQPAWEAAWNERIALILEAIEQSAPTV